MQKINGRVTGWGAYTPSRVLTNDDLSTFLDTNDEWIVRRTDHDPDTSHAELTRDFQTNALIAASYERDAFFLHA